MTMHKFSELLDWQLEDDAQDIRGQSLVTASGQSLGMIDDMIVDTDQGRVSAVVLDNGRDFPVEDIEITQDAVIAHDVRPERPEVIYFRARLMRAKPGDAR